MTTASPNVVVPSFETRCYRGNGLAVCEPLGIVAVSSTDNVVTVFKITDHVFVETARIQVREFEDAPIGALAFTDDCLLLVCVPGADVILVVDTQAEGVIHNISTPNPFAIATRGIFVLVCSMDPSSLVVFKQNRRGMWSRARRAFSLMRLCISPFVQHLAVTPRNEGDTTSAISLSNGLVRYGDGWLMIASLGRIFHVCPGRRHCGIGEKECRDPADLAWVTAFGLIVRDQAGHRLQVFRTPDQVRMHSMSGLRLAWLCAWHRALQTNFRKRIRKGCKDYYWV